MFHCEGVEIQVSRVYDLWYAAWDGIDKEYCGIGNTMHDAIGDMLLSTTHNDRELLYSLGRYPSRSGFNHGA